MPKGGAVEHSEYLAWDNAESHDTLADAYAEFTNANRCLMFSGLYQYTVRGAVVTIWPQTTADTGRIAELDAYYAAHPKQAADTPMTGAFAGKNLIFIMMESMDDWLVTPESRPNGGRNPFQYFVVPMKGFAAFHDTMVRADDVLERLEKKPWSGPAAVMLAEHDGLVETEDLLARFDRAFPNPRTRIFWYGEERFARGLSAHVRILPEAVPEKRIASFSHMSMTYRPDNPMYGESGAERLCWNGQSKAESKACEEGAEIWYSGERHQPGDGRNCAKLTFNPWYDEQLAGILDVMAR